MVAIADVADDDFATVYADAEADRFAQIVLKELIELVDVNRDLCRRPERLAACSLRIGAEPEQRQLSVADELVGLAAAFDHRLRDRAEEAVDDEDGVERQALFR